MRIRDATAGDADRLARVHIDTWRAAYRHILPADFLAGLSYERRGQRWRDQLAQADPQRFILVVEDDAGDLVAFAGGGPERDGTPGYDGEIYVIYVLPGCQRRVVGRQLMAACARRLAAQGFRAALLWVLEENRQARAFYGALGGGFAGRKTVVIGETPLPELAYGWPDLGVLLVADDRTGVYEAG